MIIGDGIMLGAGGESASIFVTGLSETDTVTASKDGKTVIGKWTQIPNPAYVVPDGYTQLEYIQNTGTQYIDTGILLNPLNGFEIDCKFSTLTSGVRQLMFGNHRTANEESLNVELNSDNTLRYYASGDVGTSTKASTGKIYNVHVEYNNSTKLLRFSSELGSASATKSYTKAFTLKMRLFLDNRDNPTETFGSEKIRMYRYSVSVGGTYIQNLIPCKRNSDNTIGMYDLVSNTFFGNSGTGTFVAGAEIPQTIDGFLIDKIKSYGTWTVKATDGTETATKTVVVDSAVQYGVEMSSKLWLYRDGDECEDATGGWTSSNSNYLTIHKNNDNMLITRLYVPTAYYNIAKTSNIINFNGYTKIGVAWEGLTANNSELNCDFASPSYKDESGYIVRATQQTDTSGEVVVDIPSLTEDCVVGIGISNTSGSWTSGDKLVTVKRIWLE